MSRRRGCRVQASSTLDATHRTREDFCVVLLPTPAKAMLHMRFEKWEGGYVAAFAFHILIDLAEYYLCSFCTSSTRVVRMLVDMEPAKLVAMFGGLPESCVSMQCLARLLR